MKLQVFLLCLVGAVFAGDQSGYTSFPGNPFNCIPDKPCYNPPISPTRPFNPITDCPADGPCYRPPVTPTRPFNPITDCLADAPCFPQPSSTYLPGGNNIFSQTGYSRHQDQKNVYFFAAPDDEQAARLRVYIQPSSRRNTKVIFIKAPGHGGVVPEVIAPPSEAIDRTLVYVLSKKQHAGGSVTIPANLGIKQAKPEVYFVKYRNQHDAEAAVQQGLNGHRVGYGLDDLGNAQGFTSTLDVRSGLIGDGVATNDGASVIASNYGPPSGSGPY